MYDIFREEIRKFAEVFNKKNYNLIKIVSHNDCDGICAAAVLSETFRRKEIKFSLSITKRLSFDLLKEIRDEKWDLLIFSDFGSSYLKEIKEIFGNRDVVVFDHHLVDEKVDEVYLINPHVFGIKDYNEISGAGIAYLFSKYLGANQDLAYLGLMGAIGDIQGERGFFGFNKEILDDCVRADKIEIKNGLRMFGSQTRPLHKILEYSTDPYIPGVTGNEIGVMGFLEELGIKYREGNKWLKLSDLNKEDLKKLISGIIIKRLGSEEKPEDIFGEIYLLKDEYDGSLTKDIKEFSTLLNACGRMGKPSLGVSACLNKEDRSKALDLLKNYKGELIRSLNWFYENKNSIMEGKNYCIVNAGDNISETLIGVLASMIAKSNLFDNGTVLVFMANTKDGYIKFSGRIVGKKDINLKEIFSDAKEIGAEIGGHKFAAGGFIEQRKEKELLNFLERKFK